MTFQALLFVFFFFNDTATTEIYTLSLHDALPILTISTLRYEPALQPSIVIRLSDSGVGIEEDDLSRIDRKSTRLNSSHLGISYAVFCLKKKKKMRKVTAHTSISYITVTQTRYLKS